MTQLENQSVPPTIVKTTIPSMYSTKVAAFDISDEEEGEDQLSDLENFSSIQTILAKGGDVARRVEFILNQFGKSSHEEPESLNRVKSQKTTFNNGGGGVRKRIWPNRAPNRRK